ncbi:MAG: MFS transporter [Actinomycetota bacterium]|nr:MFS transporter [Actinomycetota bacterium]
MGDNPPFATASFGRDRPAVIVGLICLSALGTFLAQGLLFPSLPRLMVEEIGTTKRTAGLIMTAASLSALLSRPWTGQFIDRHGRRLFLILGPLLTAVSGVGLLAARSVPQLLVLRLLQGLAGAMFYGAASASVSDVAPNDRRATYLARYSLFFYVGFATGPALAELLISTRGFDAV